MGGSAEIGLKAPKPISTVVPLEREQIGEATQPLLAPTGLPPVLVSDLSNQPANVSAQQEVLAMAGKDALPEGGTVASHGKIMEYAGAHATAYTQDVNYKGGPDQAATAEYLALLERGFRNKRVLDVGCGDGKLPNEIESLRRARLVVGIDLSQDFLAQAVRDKAANAGFVRGDMTRLPFPSESLDAVISRFALHYTPDLPALFVELARVMKPGAELTFVTNMVDGKNGAAVPQSVIDERWIPIRLSDNVEVKNLAHTSQAYFSALEAAGFDVVLERRFAANHKLTADYAHKDEIELAAVIVRAKKRLDTAASS